MQKILIYNSGGGIGDSIQIIHLILSLNHYFKKSQIYYIGAHENHYKGKLKECGVFLKKRDDELKNKTKKNMNFSDWISRRG